MLSHYPILNDRPIDQWKVVDLKEELKRRQIPVRGLKEDLVRRLDEAIRNEMSMAKEEQLQSDPKPDSDYQDIGSPVQEDPAEKDRPDNPPDAIGKIVNENTMIYVDDSTADIPDTKDHSAETVPLTGNDATIVEPAVHPLQMEDSATESQRMASHNDSTVHDSNIGETHDEWQAPVEDAKRSLAEPEKKVPVVSPDLGSPVKSESITTDSVSINEKYNLNADNFHLELEFIKPEMVQPSSKSVPSLGGDVHSSDDDKEQHKNLVPLDQVDTKQSTEPDIGKKEDTVDVGSPEKLNLDRSSGDESVDEDVIEAKHVEPSTESINLVEQSAVIKDYAADEATDTVAVMAGPNLEKDNAINDEKNKPTVLSEKRKLEVQPLVGNTEPVKRLRRWSSETQKVPQVPPERQPSYVSSSDTPKDFLQPLPTHTFTRTESKAIDDSPKECFVPQSQKLATTSLRIDKFVRPFTLKAVQQMLAMSGTVCSFWMDQIKTHCYVTYSSVEEAVATRNAVYNLQWPPNGGNLLVAEFVDPLEVKMRVEALAQLPAPIIPIPNAPRAPGFQQSQPAHPTDRQNVEPLLHEQVLPPPPSRSQPPPLSDSSFVTKELPMPPLNKPELPAPLTLDDLFKRTKTTPRIYYLPLTEEEAAAKLSNTRGKLIK